MILNKPWKRLIVVYNDENSQICSGFFSVQFSFLSRHVAFYGRFAGNLWQYVYRYGRRWTARLSGPALCQRHEVEKDEHTRTDRMHFDLLLFLYKQLPLIKRCTCILFRFRKHRLGSDLFRKLFFFAQAAMTEAVGLLWMIFQPVLFGLIGAAVRIEQIQDPYIVGKIWGCHCYSSCY